MKSFLCLALLLVFLPAPFSVLPYLNKAAPESTQTSVVSLMAPFSTVQRVVIDAGHGGRDFGAISPWGIREKDLVLEAAKALRDELKSHGVGVIMTRNRDRFIPLSRRARIANKREADLFVSIHANASSSETLGGFEIYMLSDVRSALARGNEPSNSLEAALWDLKETEKRKEAFRVAGFIQDSVEGSVPLSANRLRRAGFYVLKQTECPAVLIEIGYLTNHENAAQLGDSEYKKKLVQAIVGGILNYKSDFERTDGFAE